MSRGVAFARRLDLDHFGAVIGEREGEIGPGEEKREVEDPQPPTASYLLQAIEKLERLARRELVGIDLQQRLAQRVDRGLGFRLSLA